MSHRKMSTDYTNEVINKIAISSHCFFFIVLIIQQYRLNSIVLIIHHWFESQFPSHHYWFPVHFPLFLLAYSYNIYLHMFYWTIMVMNLTDIIKSNFKINSFNVSFSCIHHPRLHLVIGLFVKISQILWQEGLDTILSW